MAVARCSGTNLVLMVTGRFFADGVFNVLIRLAAILEILTKKDFRCIVFL